jgi:hypothetical protein
MYTLRDTFNNHPISRHRCLFAAVRARRKHARDIRRRNGGNAYVTYAITDDADERVPSCEIETVEHVLDTERR